ncbi:MAG: hypothetical protein H8E14_11895 [Candidatus Marinimicrobia bacterium]|nr:hypothetical protein [Candidatus Neomarinimicrobiota bacterium]
MNDFKIPFIAVLERRIEVIKEALSFYKNLDGSLPESEREKLVVNEPFYDKFGEVLDGDDHLIPNLLATELEVAEEYYQAIKAFSHNELKAFILGLGLEWKPYQYWGIPALEDYINKIEDAIQNNLYSSQNISLSTKNLMQPLNAENIVQADGDKDVVQQLNEISKFLNNIKDIMQSS